MIITFGILNLMLIVSIAWVWYLLIKRYRPAQTMLRNVIFGMIAFLAGIWGVAIFGVPTSFAMPIHRYLVNILGFSLMIYGYFDMRALQLYIKDYDKKERSL